MKLRVALKKIVHYVRTDLREIAFPSSLPDPPHVKARPKPRKLKLREHLQVWRTASWLYIQTWKTGNLSDKEDEEEEKQTKKSPEEHSALEELALAARAGSEHLRPALQRVYMTRVGVYRDALRNFVEGYKEGIGEVMAGNQSSKNHKEGSGGVMAGSESLGNHEEVGDVYSQGKDGNQKPYAVHPDAVESKKEQSQ